MRRWWWGLMLGGATAAWASEPAHGCFRTAAEAAAGVAAGPEFTVVAGADQGYRVQRVVDDSLVGRSWAVVGSCAHPERPAVMVEVLGRAGAAEPAGSAAQRSSSPASSAPAARVAAQFGRPTAPVLLAGARVEVTRAEPNVHVSLFAVAERSAALGERVRLRIVREAGEPEEYVEGVVRSPWLVEMEGYR